MQILENLWKMLENTERLNFSPKTKGIILYQNQIIINKVFHRISISNRNEKKTQIIMNKPFYLGFSILELSKILLYEFWHDYVKPKYGERAKLCYMDTDIYCQIYTVLLYT